MDLFMPWKSIVEDVHHEEISTIKLMNQLNAGIYLKVKFSDSGFKGEYNRKFGVAVGFSSQLIWIEWIILKWDSFYSGVAEGKCKSRATDSNDECG
jgi:hypothetical protein